MIQPMLGTWKCMARILVIDDAADMRTLLEHTLRSAGHEVVLAADGREGVQQYRTQPADLVITDLCMPIQQGLETIIQLRKESPTVRIIAMCGKPTAMPMLSAARSLGAVAVLQKPFSPDQLLAEVAKVL